MGTLPIITSLTGLRVSDVMHEGFISCPPYARLRDVARMLASHRVHAVFVVTGDHSDWRAVTDVDLLRAARTLDIDRVDAAAYATEPVETVAPDAALDEVVEQMLESGRTHAIVLDPQTGRPFGVLSTLDVARALAGYATQAL